jgi:hypothetical protein
MKPFNGLHIFEKAGTILAVNNNEESEDSETDKAKPRVIVGRLPALTGGRSTVSKMEQAGKVTPACRNAAVRPAGWTGFLASGKRQALRRAGTDPERLGWPGCRSRIERTGFPWLHSKGDLFFHL